MGNAAPSNAHIRALRWLAAVILLALSLTAGSTPAFAAGSDRMESSCRVITAASATYGQALARLDHCTSPAPHGAAGTLWIDYRSLPTVARGSSNLRFLFDDTRADTLDAWAIRQDGSRQHVSYDLASPTREWATGDYLSLRFDGATAPVVRIVVRLGGAQSAALARAPKLKATRSFASDDRDSAARYGIAVGMLAVTILFHLSLFFAIRHRFQLFYCVHTALLLVYAISYSSLIMLIAPQLSATMISRLLSFSALASTATGTFFVIDFLGSLTPNLLRRWARVGAAATLLASLFLLAGPAAMMSMTYLFANFAGIHSLLLIAALLIAGSWRRSPTAAVMLVGWAPPVVVALLFPLRNLGVIGDDVIPDGAMLVALTFECLVLSLPVSQRIKALRLDHERASERHSVLERQALTDALTGLTNRRGFTEAIERVYGRLAKPVRIGVLVIDIDHFKRINDRYGHLCGDSILCHVANQVARVAGPGAIVSRYGGEEFVVLLRDYDLVRAGALAERLRIGVGAGIGDPFEAALPPVSISIGVSSGQSDDIDRLIADGDRALYRAKNDGRNRVALATITQPRLSFAA